MPSKLLLKRKQALLDHFIANEDITQHSRLHITKKVSIYVDASSLAKYKEGLYTLDQVYLTYTIRNVEVALTRIAEDMPLIKEVLEAVK